MSRYLVDSNALYWLMTSNPALGPASRRRLQTADHVAFSAASIWELEIKRLGGRLDRDEPFEAVSGATGLVELPVSAAHARAIASVEMPHRDPFDRLLLAQAAWERLTLITSDRKLLALGRSDVVDARE